MGGAESVGQASVLNESVTVDEVVYGSSIDIPRGVSEQTMGLVVAPDEPPVRPLHHTSQDN